MPLIYSLSEIQYFEIDYNILVPTLFVIISILLISKIPTYAMKQISVPRKMTIFLLFGIIFYFGLILVYTINAILISGIIYLAIIPVSYLHYKNLNNKFKDQIIDNDEDEDIL